MTQVQESKVDRIKPKKKLLEKKKDAEETEETTVTTMEVSKKRKESKEQEVEKTLEKAVVTKQKKAVKIIKNIDDELNTEVEERTIIKTIKTKQPTSNEEQIILEETGTYTSNRDIEKKVPSLQITSQRIETIPATQACDFDVSHETTSATRKFSTTTALFSEEVMAMQEAKAYTSNKDIAKNLTPLHTTEELIETMPSAETAQFETTQQPKTNATRKFSTTSAVKQEIVVANEQTGTYTSNKDIQKRTTLVQTTSELIETTPSYQTCELDASHELGSASQMFSTANALSQQMVVTNEETTSYTSNKDIQKQLPLIQSTKEAIEIMPTSETCNFDVSREDGKATRKFSIATPISQQMVITNEDTTSYTSNKDIERKLQPIQTTNQSIETMTLSQTSNFDEIHERSNATTQITTIKAVKQEIVVPQESTTQSVTTASKTTVATRKIDTTESFNVLQQNVFDGVHQMVEQKKPLSAAAHMQLQEVMGITVSETTATNEVSETKSIDTQKQTSQFVIDASLEAAIVTEAITQMSEIEMLPEKLPQQSAATASLECNEGVNVIEVNDAECETNLPTEVKASEMKLNFQIPTAISITVDEIIPEDKPEKLYPERFVPTEFAEQTIATSTTVVTSFTSTSEKEGNFEANFRPEMRQAVSEYEERKGGVTITEQILNEKEEIMLSKPTLGVTLQGITVPANISFTPITSTVISHDTSEDIQHLDIDAKQAKLAVNLGTATENTFTTPMESESQYVNIEQRQQKAAELYSTLQVSLQSNVLVQESEGTLQTLPKAPTAKADLQLTQQSSIITQDVQLLDFNLIPLKVSSPLEATAKQKEPKAREAALTQTVLTNEAAVDLITEQPDTGTSKSSITDTHIASTIAIMTVGETEGNLTLEGSPNLQSARPSTNQFLQVVESQETLLVEEVDKKITYIPETANATTETLLLEEKGVTQPMVIEGFQSFDKIPQETQAAVVGVIPQGHLSVATAVTQESELELVQLELNTKKASRNIQESLAVCAGNVEVNESEQTLQSEATPQKANAQLTFLPVEGISGHIPSVQEQEITLEVSDQKLLKTADINIENIQHLIHSQADVHDKESTSDMAQLAEHRNAQESMTDTHGLVVVSVNLTGEKEEQLTEMLKYELKTVQTSMSQPREKSVITMNQSLEQIQEFQPYNLPAGCMPSSSREKALKSITLEEVQSSEALGFIAEEKPQQSTAKQQLGPAQMEKTISQPTILEQVTPYEVSESKEVKATFGAQESEQLSVSEVVLADREEKCPSPETIEPQHTGLNYENMLMTARATEVMQSSSTAPLNLPTENSAVAKVKFIEQKQMTQELTESLDSYKNTEILKSIEEHGKLALEDFSSIATSSIAVPEDGITQLDLSKAILQQAKTELIQRPLATAQNTSILPDTFEGKLDDFKLNSESTDIVFESCKVIASIEERSVEQSSADFKGKFEPKRSRGDLILEARPVANVTTVNTQEPECGIQDKQITAVQAKTLIGEMTASTVQETRVEGITGVLEKKRLSLQQGTIQLDTLQQLSSIAVEPIECEDTMQAYIEPLTTKAQVNVDNLKYVQGVEVIANSDVTDLKMNTVIQDQKATITFPVLPVAQIQSTMVETKEENYSTTTEKERAVKVFQQPLPTAAHNLECSLDSTQHLKPIQQSQAAAKQVFEDQQVITIMETIPDDKEGTHVSKTEPLSTASVLIPSQQALESTQVQTFGTIGNLEIQKTARKMSATSSVNLQDSLEVHTIIVHETGKDLVTKTPEQTKTAKTGMTKLTHVSQDTVISSQHVNTFETSVPTVEHARPSLDQVLNSIETSEHFHFTDVTPTNNVAQPQAMAISTTIPLCLSATQTDVILLDSESPVAPVNLPDKRTSKTNIEPHEQLVVSQPHLQDYFTDMEEKLPREQLAEVTYTGTKQTVTQNRIDSYESANQLETQIKNQTSANVVLQPVTGIQISEQTVHDTLSNSTDFVQQKVVTPNITMDTETPYAQQETTEYENTEDLSNLIYQTDQATEHTKVNKTIAHTVTEQTIFDTSEHISSETRTTAHANQNVTLLEPIIVTEETPKDSVAMINAPAFSHQTAKSVLTDTKSSAVNTETLSLDALEFMNIAATKLAEAVTEFELYQSIQPTENIMSEETGPISIQSNEQKTATAIMMPHVPVETQDVTQLETSAPLSLEKLLIEAIGNCSTETRNQIAAQINDTQIFEAIRNLPFTKLEQCSVNLDVTTPLTHLNPGLEEFGVTFEGKFTPETRNAVICFELQKSIERKFNIHLETEVMKDVMKKMNLQEAQEVFETLTPIEQSTIFINSTSEDFQSPLIPINEANRNIQTLESYTNINTIGYDTFADLEQRVNTCETYHEVMDKNQECINIEANVFDSAETFEGQKVEKDKAKIAHPTVKQHLTQLVKDVQDSTSQLNISFNVSAQAHPEVDAVMTIPSGIHQVVFDDLKNLEEVAPSEAEATSALQALELATKQEEVSLETEEKLPHHKMQSTCNVTPTQSAQSVNNLTNCDIAMTHFSSGINKSESAVGSLTDTLSLPSKIIVEALQSESNLNSVAFIRAKAESCQIPLEETTIQTEESVTMEKYNAPDFDLLAATEVESKIAEQSETAILFPIEEHKDATAKRIQEETDSFYVEETIPFEDASKDQNTTLVTQAATKHQVEHLETGADVQTCVVESICSPHEDQIALDVKKVETKTQKTLHLARKKQPKNITTDENVVMEHKESEITSAKPQIENKSPLLDKLTKTVEPINLDSAETRPADAKISISKDKITTAVVPKPQEIPAPVEEPKPVKQPEPVEVLKLAQEQKNEPVIEVKSDEKSEPTLKQSIKEIKPVDEPKHVPVEEQKPEPYETTTDDIKMALPLVTELIPEKTTLDENKSITEILKIASTATPYNEIQSSLVEQKNKQSKKTEQLNTIQDTPDTIVTCETKSITNESVKKKPKSKISEKQQTEKTQPDTSQFTVAASTHYKKGKTQFILFTKLNFTSGFF